MASVPEWSGAVKGGGRNTPKNGVGGCDGRSALSTDTWSAERAGDRAGGSYRLTQYAGGVPLGRGVAYRISHIAISPALPCPALPFYAMRSALCALRSALCALRSALCALRSAPCPSTQCALRSALCALRSALCALRGIVRFHSIGFSPMDCALHVCFIVVQYQCADFGTTV